VGTDAGAPFVVMELLEGQSLRACLAAGSVPVPRAVDYATQAALGLAAAHEKGILEEVTKLRSQWGAAKTTAEKADAATQLEGGLARLLLVAEQYPDLKASTNFKDLQYELAGTENRITVERQRYNDAIRSYNTRIRQFPWSRLASFHGFQPNTAYFESAALAKEAPKVQF
jgi:LemA protein